MSQTTPTRGIDTADAAVGRGVRRLVRPMTSLVNAPYILVGAILGIWVVCSMSYAVLERKGPIESLWWGIVTGSTVGYGDYYPETTAGRGVAMVLIVSMLVLVPIAIGHVIANLVLDQNQFTHQEQVALAARVEATHDQVETLRHLVVQGLVATHGEEWVRDQVDTLARTRASAGGDEGDALLDLFRDVSQ